MATRASRQVSRNGEEVFVGILLQKQGRDCREETQVEDCEEVRGSDLIIYIYFIDI